MTRHPDSGWKRWRRICRPAPLSPDRRPRARVPPAVVFATPLFAGVLLRAVDKVLGWSLSATSVVPLAHVVATWRSC